MNLIKYFDFFLLRNNKNYQSYLTISEFIIALEIFSIFSLLIL